MTVNELLSVAVCDAVTIIIRENGDSKWIYAYEIGEDVQVGKYDYFMDSNGRLTQAGKFYKPTKPIEVMGCHREMRKLIIPKKVSKLPKEVKDLKVASFRRTYIGPKIDHAFEIWCYPKGFVPPLTMLQSDQAKLDERQFTLFDNANNTDETEETSNATN